MRGCEPFLAAGGRELTRIPCMNEHPLWIAALEKMIARVLSRQPRCEKLRAYLPRSVG